MNVLVIGGGASGMMAAISAAQSGCSVTLAEKNEKLGKKLYLTGKGRCNVTNNCDVNTFLDNVNCNKKFLMSAIHGFTPADTIDFFQNNGLPLKTERGNRVFPVSDKASDVTRVFEKMLKILGVKVLLNCQVSGFEVKNGIISGVDTSCGKLYADRFILCSGGVTYRSTGSDGFGLKLCKNLGHNIIEPRAGLVGLKIDSPSSLAGLTLKNVTASIWQNGKKLFSEFGEMLFTHTGVSGPIILTLSSKISRLPVANMSLSIDLKPALDEKSLDLRVQRDFAEFSNKQFSNSLDNLLPHSLIGFIIKKSAIPPDTKVHQITVSQRSNLVKLLKDLRFDLSGTEDIDYAIITCGGIDVKEIEPKTMRSKMIPNLYFAGEIIDVDAFTGGFNLQTAFCTGNLAGKSCAD